MKKHRFSFSTTEFAALAFVFLFPLIGHAAYVWDRQLPIPDDDPSWETVARLWDNRWEGGRFYIHFKPWYRKKRNMLTQNGMFLTCTKSLPTETSLTLK